MTNPELERAKSAIDNKTWKRWGPYLSERQWGTVREDYSKNGEAWSFINHDKSRSNAYRWGEEGISGFCDNKQTICLAPAFWNGKDPILKERLFGLSGPEGNHGEDVKELYYYLENTPSHSYCRMLYKYPQSEFPYDQLVHENKKRNKFDPEFEISDSGVFENNQYFDIYGEYAKNDIHDILWKITAVNKYEKDAPLHILPHIWYRNFWKHNDEATRPTIKLLKPGVLKLENQRIGTRYFYYPADKQVLFCENETNITKVYGGDKEFEYPKDGINDYVVNGDADTINPTGIGTKAAIHFIENIAAHGSVEVKVRFSDQLLEDPFGEFDQIFETRKKECDQYYDDLADPKLSEESKRLQKIALSNMLWSKQFYYYDVYKWKRGDKNAGRVERKSGRNEDWQHLVNKNILSMPDTWEYPWFAAWDLAFHTTTLAYVDPYFAKRQLLLMLREYYMHPNGQIPAYEWNFSDVNPPVHAWGCWKVYEIDKEKTGVPDYDFLERTFQKLSMNFTWWVNQKDASGKNLFQGGFLGLDNIGVFDRSNPPKGVQSIEQADATSWMAMFCLNMLRMSLELCKQNKSYQESASKFFGHFLFISKAMNNIGNKGIDMWDDEDGFFYDIAHLEDDTCHHMKVRSLVGVIPMFAVEVITHEMFDELEDFKRRSFGLITNRADLAALISRVGEAGRTGQHLFASLRGHRLHKLIDRLGDPEEFLSEYGIRSMSKYHEKNPFVFSYDGDRHEVKYEPGESQNYMFGGNSNWRGPIWLPINYLIIESLRKFYSYYGDDYKCEFPKGSGQKLNLNEIADDLSKRLLKLFKQDSKGNYNYDQGYSKELSSKDEILFFEYFHAETGKGLGASHQTGWTGLVANLLLENPELGK